MNCQDVQKFAFTYLDAEFDARERGEFEEHLKLCGPCRLAVNRDAQMKETVARHLLQIHAGSCQGAELRSRVCASLERAERRRVRQSIGVTVALAATVVTVVAVGQAVPGDHSERQVAGTAPAPAASAKQAVPVLAARAAVVPQALPGSAAMANPAVPAAPAEQFAALRAADLRRADREPGAIQRVSARLDAAPAAYDAGEVLGGRLGPGSLVERSPFGAVRSEESLRQMVQLHTADPPPEIAGPPARIQRYLQARLPGVGPLPLAEGAGIDLRGARIAVLGGRLVVIYSYTAYGSPLTVVGRAIARGDEPDIEAVGPDSKGPSGVMLDRRAGIHLLHVVEQNRVLTLVGELSAPAMMQLLPTGRTE